MTNARIVDWTPLDLSAPEPVQAGDLVSADAGGLPIYRVVALDEGRAWVAAGPIATGRAAPARAMPLSQFRWRARLAA